MMQVKPTKGHACITDPSAISYINQ